MDEHSYTIIQLLKCFIEPGYTWLSPKYCTSVSVYTGTEFPAHEWCERFWEGNPSAYLLCILQSLLNIAQKCKIKLKK
jgi:hypothetical protein